MSPEMRRRVLLGVLVVAVGLAGWIYAGQAPGPGAAARSAASSAAARPGRQGQGYDAPPGVQLAVLEASRSRPSQSGRNPFIFGARQAEPVPEDARRTPPREVPVFAPPPVPTGPPPPPPMPPIPLKFIGLVEGAAGNKIAVLSDSKGFVAHGAEGAIIDGRYRILSIGAETVELAYADGRGRQTLRLSGQ